MRTLIFLFISVMLLNSCVTESRCNRKFPPKETIVVKDSIINTTNTVYKDTTIYKLIKGDLKHDTLWLMDNTTLRKSALKTPLCTSESYVLDNVLYHKLIQKDTVLKLRLENAVRITWNEAKKFYSEKQTIVKTQRYIPKWCYYTIAITIFTLLNFAYKIRKIFIP